MISIVDVRLGSKTSLQLFVSKVQFIKNPKDFQTWIVSSLLPYIYYSFCFSKTHTNDNNITNKETLIWGKDRTKFLYLKKSWICAYRDHNRFDAFRIQNRHAFATPLSLVVLWRNNKPVKMALNSRHCFHWSVSFACKKNSYSNCTLNTVFIVMIFSSTFHCKYS